MLQSHPDDLSRVRHWFKALQDCVQAVDYKAAYPLFDPDMIAFGTFTDFMTGRDTAEREQWSNVWPTVRNFRWRDDIRAIVSPDRLGAAGLAIFDSDGFNKDGSRFDRRGRATVVLQRRALDQPWVCAHTHLSLFRGTPGQSFGPPPYP